MNMCVSDESLMIALSKDQDVNAYTEIFKRFSGKIFAIGIKHTRNEQFAKDLSQEAMLKVWRKATQFNADKGTAQNWILTLARNQCFDMLRSQRRKPQHVPNKEDMWSEDTIHAPQLLHEEDGTKAVETAQLERLYHQLPETQREVIEQLYVHGLTHEEAAEHLQIPLGTLKSRSRWAIKKLRLWSNSDE